jgi:hypothetical protein
MRDLGKEKIQGIKIFLFGLFVMVVSWWYLGLVMVAVGFGISIIGVTVLVVAKKDSTKLAEPKILDVRENIRTLVILIALTVFASLLFLLWFH